MNWEAIGVVSEVVAAIAVVASLIYLSIQVRDSKNSTIAATHYEVTEAINTAYTTIAESSDLSHIYLKGNHDPSELGREELARYMILIGGIFARYNNYYMQHERGTLSDEPWGIAVTHMQSLMQYKGVQWWWKGSRQHYLAGMKELLDGMVEAALNAKAEELKTQTA